MTITEEAPSVDVVVCSGCNGEQPLVGEGLCEVCYRREHPKARLIECADCGKTRRNAAHGLCHVCYEKTRIIECARCGEIKRRAAHGLCHACYSRVYRDPGIVAREVARVEHNRALHQQLVERIAEWQQRRCKTCQRLLCLTRDTMHWRTKFCDMFCQNHHPDRRAARGSTGWIPKVTAKLDARKAEADRQVEGMR